MIEEDEPRTIAAQHRLTHEVSTLGQEVRSRFATDDVVMVHAFFARVTEVLATLATGAITDPQYFRDLGLMATRDVPLSAAMMGAYILRVLAPLAPEVRCVVLLSRWVGLVSCIALRWSVVRVRCWSLCWLVSCVPLRWFCLFVSLLPNCPATRFRGGHFATQHCAQPCRKGRCPPTGPPH